MKFTILLGSIVLATVINALSHNDLLSTNSLFYNMTWDGIIFKDFQAQLNTQRFNGSLAVQGNFTASGFTVNGKRPTINCTPNNQYGLAVGGQLNVQNTIVNGAFNVLNFTSGITFTSPSCSNTSTAPVDFNQLYATATNVSHYLASQKPNMVIRDGGFLSDGQFDAESNQEFYIYTFNRCQEKVGRCVIPDYLYSSSENIFLGGNWTGPWNTEYPIDKRVIFNIPVLTNTVFNMSTNNPSAGLENADIVYNVYPVTTTGAPDPQGHIIWFRNTTQTLGGHVLAPNAFIIENNQGGFTGNLIAAKYLSIDSIQLTAMNLL